MDCLQGLTERRVHSEATAVGLFFRSLAARATGEHAHNAASSRSHYIFSLIIDVRKSAAKSERAIVSRFNLVDLAGSERGKKTASAGQCLKECLFINQSLSFLEQVRRGCFL